MTTSECKEWHSDPVRTPWVGRGHPGQYSCMYACMHATTSMPCMTGPVHAPASAAARHYCCALYACVRMCKGYIPPATAPNSVPLMLPQVCSGGSAPHKPTLSATLQQERAGKSLGVNDMDPDRWFEFSSSVCMLLLSLLSNHSDGSMPVRALPDKSRCRRSSEPHSTHRAN